MARVLTDEKKVNEKRPLTPTPGSGEQSLTKGLDGESSQNTASNRQVVASSAESRERKCMNEDTERIARMILEN